ncbi:MAG: thermonuclease family protein [Deltaproteobacteria bacterium]|nr:thermonuclease family protein [Deltaproteobacteria bacterium]
MTSDFFQGKSYQKFVKKLEEISSSDDEFSELTNNQRVLQSHWKKGKYISQFREKVPYGQKEEYYSKLAKDLKRDRSLIFLLQKLFDLFPEGIPQFPGSEKLSWSKYTVLLTVDANKERDYYLKLAAEEDLSRDRLRKAIKEELYQKLQEQKSKKHPNGTLERPTDPSFLFIADPKTLKNPDVDTLEALLDQGFRSWHRDTFRLRGINGPEIHGPEHELAMQGKIFLEEKLKNAALILIKTYKTDKYGRYIADVIYHPVWTDPAKVFKEGIYLNQELLDEGLVKFAVY